MRTRVTAEIIEEFGSVTVKVYVPNVYEHSSMEKYHFTKNSLKETKKAAKDYFNNNKINGEFYTLDFTR